MPRMYIYAIGAYFLLGPFLVPDWPFVSALQPWASIAIGMFLLVSQTRSDQKLHRTFIAQLDRDLYLALKDQQYWRSTEELHLILKAAYTGQTIYDRLLEHQEQGAVKSQKRRNNVAKPWDEPNWFTHIEWKLTSNFNRPRRLKGRLPQIPKDGPRPA